MTSFTHDVIAGGHFRSTLNREYFKQEERRQDKPNRKWSIKPEVTKPKVKPEVTFDTPLYRTGSDYFEAIKKDKNKNDESF
jgi:hypothetical protein